MIRKSVSLIERVSQVSACFLVCAVLVGANTSTAATLYRWDGACATGCTGSATGELMVRNGADITNLTAADFVSWSYESDQFSIAFTATDIIDPLVFDFSGDLTLDTFKIDVLTVVPNPDFDYLFVTDGNLWDSLNFLSGQSDSGDRSRLALVPLPAALPLMATALICLGFAGFKRRVPDAI